MIKSGSVELVHGLLPVSRQLFGVAISSPVSPTPTIPLRLECLVPLSEHFSGCTPLVSNLSHCGSPLNCPLVDILNDDLRWAGRGFAAVAVAARRDKVRRAVVAAERGRHDVVECDAD